MGKGEVGWPEWIAAIALLILAYIALVLLVPSVHFQLDSGWVQAIGSVIGIGIAIWVPYAQRRADRIAARGRDLERELLRWNSVYHLLHDTIIWLSYMQSMGDNRRSHARQDRHVDDLLDRIGSIERQEESIMRQNALNAARNAVILVHADLTQPWSQDKPFTEQERKLMQFHVERLTNWKNVTYQHFQDADKVRDEHQKRHPEAIG